MQNSYEAAEKSEDEDEKADNSLLDPEQMRLDLADGVLFLSGNPQVRLLTGTLRFYRPDTVLPLALDTDEHGLPKLRNRLVCIVTVPSHMSPIELIEFLNTFRDNITLVRILKDPERSNCMALLQFKTQDRADQFFLAHNGKYFNSIEQERCKIVFVRSIEVDSIDRTQHTSASDANHALFLPPSGMTEIPTCAVCLDRLDASASGILTTLCNHTFHCNCLFRWEGSSCPVCRFSHCDIGSACQVCHTTNYLWICLICGHVGCGRYSGEHAKQHYHDTLHAYSLELETQRVWDYAGDGYVHRLILNKEDGKFVEVALPNASGERSRVPPLTSEQEEEMEHQKLEKLAIEYNSLLTSQLEQQRLYYEQLMSTTNAHKHTEIVGALEQEAKTLKRANESLQSKSKKLEEELNFVRELNKSLIENQHQWKARMRQMEEEKRTLSTESAARIGALEGQVRDLMFYLDTQQRVEQSAYKHEIQGGVIQIEDRSTQNSGSNRQRSRKKQ